MLRSVTSRELAEWRAYELLNGPLGPQYERDALAAIHEMGQQIARVVVRGYTEDSSSVPDFVTYPRAGQWRQTADDDDLTLFEKEAAEAEFQQRQSDMLAREFEEREGE